MALCAAGKSMPLEHMPYPRWRQVELIGGFLERMPVAVVGIHLQNFAEWRWLFHFNSPLYRRIAAPTAFADVQNRLPISVSGIRAARISAIAFARASPSACLRRCQGESPCICCLVRRVVMIYNPLRIQ